MGSWSDWPVLFHMLTDPPLCLPNKKVKGHVESHQLETRGLECFAQKSIMG